MVLNIIYLESFKVLGSFAEFIFSFKKLIESQQLAAYVACVLLVHDSNNCALEVSSVKVTDK